MAIVHFCHSRGVARFACAQAGCQDCLAELLQENRGLVYQVIQHEGGMGMELKDLMQEGRIGLWQAIRWYDPGRGTAFSSLAWVLIRYRIWNTRRDADSQWEEEAGVWLELVDELEEEWWLKQLRQALLEEVERLPVRLQKLIVAHYGLDGTGGRSLAEIGREWGINVVNQKLDAGCAQRAWPGADSLLRAASGELQPAMGQGQPKPNLSQGQSRSPVSSGERISEACHGALSAVTRKLVVQPEPPHFSAGE